MNSAIQLIVACLFFGLAVGAVDLPIQTSCSEEVSERGREFLETSLRPEEKMYARVLFGKLPFPENFNVLDFGPLVGIIRQESTGQFRQSYRDLFTQYVCYRIYEELLLMGPVARRTPEDVAYAEMLHTIIQLARLKRSEKWLEETFAAARIKTKQILGGTYEVAPGLIDQNLKTLETYLPKEGDRATVHELLITISGNLAQISLPHVASERVQKLTVEIEEAKKKLASFAKKKREKIPAGKSVHITYAILRAQQGYLPLIGVKNTETNRTTVFLSHLPETEDAKIEWVPYFSELDMRVKTPDTDLRPFESVNNAELACELGLNGLAEVTVEEMKKSRVFIKRVGWNRGEDPTLLLQPEIFNGLTRALDVELGKSIRLAPGFPNVVELGPLVSNATPAN